MEGPAVPRARLPWVDVAKGACIVLVVLLHVTNRHLVRLDEVDAAIRDGWTELGKWMRPVRMPTFFVLSGLLAAPALARRRPVEIRRRVQRSAELYVVWLALQSFLVDRRLRPGVVTTTLDGFVDALLLPTGSLWYLWALAAYVLGLAVVPARWRHGVLAGAALAWLLVATQQWHLTPRPRDLVQYLGWFALGAYAPTAVRGVVAWATPRRTALTVAAYVAAIVWLRHRGPLYAPLFQVVGVVGGLGLAARAAGRLALGAAVLGRHTLSIYVLHIPLLTVWSHVLREHGWRGSSPVGVLMWLYPLALGAALIAASLGIEQALRRAGAGRLFGDRRPVAAIGSTPAASATSSPRS